jgi:hypothetical protein
MSFFHVGWLVDFIYFILVFEVVVEREVKEIDWGLLKCMLS